LVLELEIVNMRHSFVLLCMLSGAVTPAVAQASGAIGLPQVQIRHNVPVYPQFVQVPSNPVYYAPQLNANYFFYDGMYWVYERDNWYASDWYNGPWAIVPPRHVPAYILRVPVRYYRSRPHSFQGWSKNAPPRWGQLWGHEWEQQRGDWDHWNHSSVPRPAPLPAYQQLYTGNRYPRVEQQPVLHDQYYRYQPSEPVVRRYYQERRPPNEGAPGQQKHQAQPQEGPQSAPPGQDHGEQSQGQGKSKGPKQDNGNGNDKGGNDDGNHGQSGGQ
jgi:hypothetical protein